MSAPRWTLTTVVLALGQPTPDARPAELRRVDGYVTPAAPGLCVTRTLEGDTVPAGYTVTHRASGCRVHALAVRPTLAEAQALCLRLAELTDWTAAAERLSASPVLRDAVTATCAGAVAGVGG